MLEQQRSRRRFGFRICGAGILPAVFDPRMVAKSRRDAGATKPPML
jgi:hypothetical protein